MAGFMGLIRLMILEKNSTAFKSTQAIEVVVGWVPG
jgi:hypothetical protein